MKQYPQTWKNKYLIPLGIGFDDSVDNFYDCYTHSLHLAFPWIEERTVMLQVYFQTLNMHLMPILFLRLFFEASSTSLDDISGIFRVTSCLDRNTLLKQYPAKKVLPS